MTDWTKTGDVPRGYLEAWHQYVPGVTGNYIIYDYSGNNRHVAAAASNASVLQANILNGEPAMYFNGTTTAPLVYTGAVTIRHLFVVCAFDGATFSTYNGILSAPSIIGLLNGNSGTNKFFHFTDNDPYTYLKSDVAFAAANELAPMAGNFAVCEIQVPGGLILNGLQIGQDRADTSRRWKGWFVEDLIYSQIKDNYDRHQIFQYFAKRYRLWQKTAAGLDVFPFAANHARNVSREIEHFSSNPYEGAKTALVRGSLGREFEAAYNLRDEREFLTAESFHQTHYPNVDAVFRDYKFQTPRDSNGQITSELKEGGSDLSNLFNYGFTFKEN